MYHLFSSFIHLSIRPTWTSSPLLVTKIDAIVILKSSGIQKTAFVTLIRAVKLLIYKHNVMCPFKIFATSDVVRWDTDKF